MPGFILPRELIQHLVQMPTLIEVGAFDLDAANPTEEQLIPIETEECSWKILRCADSICRSLL